VLTGSRLMLLKRVCDLKSQTLSRREKEKTEPINKEKRRRKVKLSICFSQEAQGVTLHHQNILDRHLKTTEFLQKLFKPTLRMLCRDGFLDPEKVTTVSLLRDKETVVKKIKILPLRKIESKQTNLLEKDAKTI